MIRRWGPPGLAALLAALLLAPWLAVAAADLEGSGWWWRAQSGVLDVMVPPPPYVPEDGLFVASAPDGATALAAVRYVLTSHEANPVLTLDVAHDAGGEEAEIGACFTGAAWIPQQAGRWDMKPPAGCDAGSVAGIRSEDGETWTFALAPLRVGDVLDVLLVPGGFADPAGNVHRSFEIAFEAPTRESLSTEIAFEAPDFSFDVEEGFVAPFDEAFGEPGFAGAPAARPFEPALAPEEQAITETAPLREVPRRRGLEPVAAEEAPGRLVAAVVLAAAAGAWLWVARQPAPGPVPLGPLAVGPGPRPEAEVRGLGRFARPRTGPPPRL